MVGMVVCVVCVVWGCGSVRAGVERATMVVGCGRVTRLRGVHVGHVIAVGDWQAESTNDELGGLLPFEGPYTESKGRAFLDALRGLLDQRKVAFA